MNHDLLLAQLVEVLKRDFGFIITVRNLRKARRVQGVAWIATLAVAASEPVELGDFEVADDGTLVQPLTPDVILDHIRRAAPADAKGAAAQGAKPVDAAIDAMNDLFADDAETPGDVDEGWLDESSATAIYEDAIANGTRSAMSRARDMLPRFLADGETRGSTLFMMSEISRRLGERSIARGFLEAATREFATRFDVIGMEKCEAAAQILLGDDYRDSAIPRMVESHRTRLRPLTDVRRAPLLRAIPDSESSWIASRATTRTLRAGEYLVREGDPARAIYIIKSGVIAVLLADVKGESAMVRCVYPGFLLGESSVLSPNRGCTASLRAEQDSEVWVILAADVQPIDKRFPEFAERMRGTRHIHQIDSFLSRHGTIGELDADARADILACVHTVQTIDDDAIAITKGEVPAFACLVARGGLALYDSDSPDTSEPPIDTIGIDHFYGVRDAIHELASERTAVARRSATIVFFDAERLRAVVAASSGDVLLTLERLG